MARPDPNPREDRPGIRPAARLIGIAGTLALAFGLVRREPRTVGSLPPATASEDPSGRGNPGAPPSGRARRSGHETQDMNGAMMVRLGATLGTVAVIMIFVMIGFRTFVRTGAIARQPALTLLQTAAQRPPAPTLQANPVQEWAQVQARAATLLDNSAWTGPDHARARIPIGRAMALTAGHGMEPPP